MMMQIHGSLPRLYANPRMLWWRLRRKPMMKHAMINGWGGQDRTTFLDIGYYCEYGPYGSHKLFTPDGQVVKTWEWGDGTTFREIYADALAHRRGG